MYKFSASIIIRPELPVHRHYAKDLHVLANNVCEAFRSLGCVTKAAPFYFCPDAESETSGFELEGVDVQLSRACHRFRSVVLLSQIAASVSLLFDSNRYHCDVRINEPSEV